MNEQGKFILLLIFLISLATVGCDDPKSKGVACGPDNCDGCCDGDGGCRPGSERAFCGIAGESCSICIGGRCEAYECVVGDPCGPDNCDGCCDASGDCLTGTEPALCGSAGEACEDCLDGACEANTCVNETTCGPDNCDGCCNASGGCRPGTEPAFCGSAGEACEDCLDGACEGNTCVAVQTCGPGNCAGCCDAGGTCLGGAAVNACGSGGNTCLACGDQLCEDGGCVDPPPELRIGLWLSPWRLADRTPAQWVAAIKGLSYASSVPSRPVVVIAICGAATTTTTRCFFPQPAGVPSYANVTYSTDRVTPILNAIEADGTIEVILDVEPMNALVSNVMHVAMTAFGGYSCVKGFSPDWEWVTGDTNKISKLPTWNAELQNYKAGMELHLINWVTSAFGTWRDDALSYGYDGQSFTGLTQQLWYFDNWTSAFFPNRTAWYWAYAADSSWTRPLVQNAAQLRDLQDQYSAIDPAGMILMATETLYFEIDAMLPTSPMW
jgi:hypothetical protein